MRATENLGRFKVTRLDRLGRSLRHVVNIGADLQHRGIGLHVTEQGIDTDTAEGRAMFGMLSVLAEYQRELIIANTRDGLAAARAGAACPAALRRSGEDRQADRRHVRRTPLHRLRPPRRPLPAPTTYGLNRRRTAVESLPYNSSGPNRRPTPLTLTAAISADGRGDHLLLSRPRYLAPGDTAESSGPRRAGSVDPASFAGR